MDVFTEATRRMRAGHRYTGGQFGWSCSCGAGRSWPLAPAGRGEAAARRHARTAYNRILAELRNPATALEGNRS